MLNILTEERVAARPGSGPAIELSDVGKIYRRGKSGFVAVRPMTLSVPWGQVIGLLGPNGAGKTTTIKMICGLVTPTSGTIELGGHDVKQQRAKAVSQIGAVLEGSRNVYWTLSAWENLMYFGRLKGLRSSEIKPRARRLLTELNLWERRHQPVGSFSRGMQQKVAVAAALITDPPIILLDEPTIGLDVESAHTFKGWIAQLAASEGKTIVLTTHQLDLAQELCDRIAVVKEGEIIADLPTAELLSRHGENRFEVRVAESLHGLTDVLPTGVQVESEGAETRLTLPDADTDALYALLGRLAMDRIPLLSVMRAQPSLEEIFIRLINDANAPALERAADTTAKESVA